MPHVEAIVVGAGLAGLSAAYRLHTNGHRVAVFDPAARAGGVIDCEQIDGWHVDMGPNTVRGAGWEALALADELGLADDRVLASKHATKRYILHPTKKRLVSVSPGPGILFSSLLGLRSKWRLLTEVFRPRGKKHDDEETIAEFVIRRLSREFADRLIAPIVSGIYAGDIDRLSLSAVFPKMNAMDQRHGSLMRAALARMVGGSKETPDPASEPYRGLRRRLYSYRGGFRQVVDALAAALPDDAPTGLHLRHGVERVSRDTASGRFEVDVQPANGGPSRTWTSHAVIVTAPGRVAGRMVGDIDRRLSDSLRAIPYAPLAVVALGYRREDVGRKLDGFGFLIPRTAGVATLGSLWSSAMFPGRAPDGHVLLTNYIGGALNRDVVTLGSEELIRRVADDIRGPLDISGEPVFTRARLYEQAIPQYELGHADRVAEAAWAEERRPGLAFAGAWRGGVGVGDVVRNALKQAERISKWLQTVKSLPDDLPIMDADAAPTEVMDVVDEDDA